MKPAIFILLVGGTVAVQAADLDTIGITLLRQVDSSLRGEGVWVALPEATSDTNTLDFQVTPTSVGQPTSLFTYLSDRGTTNVFPNLVGSASGHADGTANHFFGAVSGATPNVSHVDNYDADYFFSDILSSNVPILAQVVNQSFRFETSDQPDVDPVYDNYAESNGTIFVSVVGNGGPVYPPGTCYNSISVGIYGSSSSTGPTPDGRCKPDLVAPSEAPFSANSFSAPYVAGSATVLVQAALRGDGGGDTNSAADRRTIKALLINGAIKPPDWTNGVGRPLDARYGSGVANVFNSWMQLRGGKQSFAESTLISSGSPHLPGTNSATSPVFAGWNFSSISNTPDEDCVQHYYFDSPDTNFFTLTASLVWSRHAGETNINDLDLFLFDTSTSNLVASSVSTVDNVEHLFATRLPASRYDLQVVKKGGGQVSDEETYALAFELFSVRLSIVQTNESLVLTWPLSPAGFNLQSSGDLGASPSWTAVAAPVTVDANHDRNKVVLPADGTSRFFRLARP